MYGFLPPVMRGPAGFNADLRRSQLLKELQNLPALRLLSQHRLIVLIHTMQLKTLLEVSMPMRVIFSTDGSLV
jgi:hypothetical protein